MNRFLRYFLIFLVAGLAGMAVIGYVCDPLGYFRARGLRGPWLLGDRVWGEVRVSKDLGLAGAQPETLIVGNSRVANGFDVSDPEITKQVGLAYNLGLSGALFDELDIWLQNALFNPNLKNVILGLDPGMFFVRDHQRSTYRPIPLQSMFGSLKTQAKHTVTALWSRTAMEALRSAARGRHETTIDGSSNPELKVQSIRKTGGVRSTTLKTEENLVQYFRKRDAGAYGDRMRLLQNWMNAACRQQINVKIFISPEHVRQLLLLKMTGNWKTFLKWKSDLTMLAESFQERGCVVSVTDFSRLSVYTTEIFPEPGDRQTMMQWYFESSHYTPALGRLVLQRLVGDAQADPSFGQILTTSLVKRAAAEATTELADYLQAHPDVWAETRQLNRLPGSRTIQGRP